jgi:hypothetical protein
MARTKTNKPGSTGSSKPPSTASTTPARLGMTGAVRAPVVQADASATPVPSLSGLPSPNPKAPHLGDLDFENAATEFGIDADIIRAVAKVESGGRTGFDAQGRPKILFEAQWFHKFTKGAFDSTHPQVSQPSWELGKKYYVLDQWVRLAEAIPLDRESALKSASWGVFQVMGFNHNGYPTVDDFVNAMFLSEFEHLKAFLAFCCDNKLVDKLKNKDWAGFAKAYNGPGYKQNSYDVKIQQAYEQCRALRKQALPGETAKG